MVNAADLKSAGRKVLWVRAPLPVPGELSAFHRVAYGQSSGDTLFLRPSSIVTSTHFPSGR